MTESPPLGELADDQDELEGCGVDFGPYAVDELGQLEAVLLGDTPPGTPEAEAKLAFYQALRDQADATPDEPR